MSVYKMTVFFKDGTQSATEEFQAENVKPSMKNAKIRKAVESFLKNNEKREGLVVIWGNGVVEHSTILDVTPHMKKEDK